jgi:hypothetical protein
MMVVYDRRLRVRLLLRGGAGWQVQVVADADVCGAARHAGDRVLPTQRERVRRVGRLSAAAEQRVQRRATARSYAAVSGAARRARQLVEHRRHRRRCARRRPAHCRHHWRHALRLHETSQGRSILRHLARL